MARKTARYPPVSLRTVRTNPRRRRTTASLPATAGLGLLCSSRTCVFFSSGKLPFPWELRAMLRVTLASFTAPPVGPWCRRNSIPRRSNLDENQTGLPGFLTPIRSPTPAWLGGWIARFGAVTSHYNKKKNMPIICKFFFTCSPNTKMAIFPLISEVFGHMFEQAELQGTQMGPNGPPNAKGTA